MPLQTEFPLLGGSGVALVGGGVEVSYTELTELALSFSERLGERKRVIFLETSNTVQAIAAWLGCVAGGHVVHPYAVGEVELAERRKSVFEPNVCITSSERVCELNWRHERPHQLHPDLRVLLATSGSTGAPKFVKLSEHNLLSNAASIAQYLGLGPAERAATTLDFAHAFGLSVITSHLISGGSLLLTQASIYEDAFWQAFAAGSATSFSGVPYSFEMLRRSNEWAKHPNLTHVAQAGGRLEPDLVRHFSRLGQDNGWRFQVMYGQTEASPRMAYLPPELAATRPDCIGIAIPGGKLEILDANDAIVTTPGTTGELVYSGPNVMMGYASSLDDLATDDTPEFLRTGDLGQFDEQGLFRIVGRASRFVKPFGIRVGLDDAQAIARESAPSAICVGDDNHIVVAVLPCDEAAAEGVAAAISRQYLLPLRVIHALTLDEMPLLASGKIDYKAILERAGADAPTPLKPDHQSAWPFGRPFLKRFAYEFTGIVGLRRVRWDGVEAIYSTFLGGTVSSEDQSFRDLAGDSLSYVSTQLALEDYLGVLPEDWERRSIRDLENLRYAHNGI